MKFWKIMFMVLFIFIVIICSTYAFYRIDLTDMKVRNLQIYRQIVADEFGVKTQEIFLSLDSTLYDSIGNRENKKDVFDLTVQQRNQLKSFITPFIISAASNYDVIPPAWTIE